MLLYLYYIIVGLLTGVSMGTIGVGQIICMPLLIYSGLSIKQSVAVGMLMQLLPQSIPGVINYWKNILWYPSFIVITSSIFGIWLGSYLVTKNIIKEYLLYRIITIFLFISSIYFYIYHWD